ncbi:ogr/Delta-like zinc finger family protein [Sphingomonas sp. PB4P5]|uniref:ogr/Delta-like zinc finger family protein n=1 Tax=Parasphingomonas puruogangriensis TaxID=3096155 RepID=UPI002FCB34B7
MKKRNYTPRIPAIECPHCKSRAIVRGSSEVCPMVRELRFMCTNDDCQHTYVGQLSVIYTIHASHCPNPAIRLPFGNPNLGPKRKPANDDTSPPANDDHGIGVALATVFMIT